MAFRSAWLNNAGAISRHSEVTLHAFDREIPLRPMDLLDVGVENGGSLEVWTKVLPEGSTVLGLDIDEKCLDLPLPVMLCDVTNHNDVSNLLRGEMFDVIIDSTGTMTSLLWPYLRVNGVMIYEGYDHAMITDIILALQDDLESWLPVEEVMRVNVYSEIVVIEKRNPKVIPYMQVMTGNFADVTGEAALIAQGVKRVLLN